MKVLVINGCPKGNNSITLQSALYLEKKYSEHQFAFYNAGIKYKQAEKDFSEAAKLIKSADLLLFSYPVFTFLVPSQLHRFIELMKANLSKKDLEGKFATQISTSMHFYDITAHAFIHDNCEDMGLKVIKGLSAYMDDLTTTKGQKELCDFFEYVNWCFDNNVYEPKTLKNTPPKHVKVSPYKSNESTKESRKTIALVADLAPDDLQLASMIERFTNEAKEKGIQTNLMNIHDFPFKGGCICCFNCTSKGNCFYSDGFADMLRTKVQACDGIVLAFSIKDHSMGSFFKTYDDRQFCNGHRTVTQGMPFGYLISGNYSEERNLQILVESRAEVGGNFLAGVATDETNPDLEIDNLCYRLSYALEHHYIQPTNFYGVGGMKIFRDLIWLMQGMMKADHKYYKSHHLYDFPQKRKGNMLLMYLVGGLMTNPKLKSQMGAKMNEYMLEPYKKAIESVNKNSK